MSRTDSRRSRILLRQLWTMKPDLRPMPAHVVPPSMGRVRCAVLSSLFLCVAPLDAGWAQTLDPGAAGPGSAYPGVPPAATATDPTPEAPKAPEAAKTTAEPPSEAVGDYEPRPPEVRPEEQAASAPAESTPADAAVGESDAYPLQSGDRLKIMVYDRADLTAEYRVSDPGQDSHPYPRSLRRGKSLSGSNRASDCRCP